MLLLITRLVGIVFNFPERRKLAAKLLCELVKGDEKNQSRLCEMCDFSPVHGLVTLNSSIPPKLIPKLPLLLDLIKDKRRVALISCSQKKYWAYPKYDEFEEESEDDPDD